MKERRKKLLREYNVILSRELRKEDLGFQNYAMECMQGNQLRGVVDK